MSPAPANPPATATPDHTAEANPASATEAEVASVDQVDTGYLETLIGYNARRAALTVIGLFLERMAVYGLRPVDFSVLSVIAHNPGVTSRQLCTCLGLQPPNLVIMLNQFEQRELVLRQPHPHDGRALALSLTPQGQALMTQAEETAARLEVDATAALTPAQRNTLKRLLKLIYAPPRKADKGDRGDKAQSTETPGPAISSTSAVRRPRASARRSGA